MTLTRHACFVALVALILAWIGWVAPAATFAQDPDDDGMGSDPGDDTSDDGSMDDGSMDDGDTGDTGDTGDGDTGTGDDVPDDFEDRPDAMDDAGAGDGEPMDDGSTGDTGDTTDGDGEDDGEDFTPEYKVFGFAYFGWAMDFNHPTGVANQFFLSKAYIALDASIGDQVTARFGIEMSDPSGVLGSGLLNTLFIKDAYVEVKKLFFDDSSLRVGMHPSIWLETAEEWWPYRFISRTISELQNIQQPNDFGISYKAWIRDSEDANDQFFFRVGVFNGGGAAGAQQGLFDDLPTSIQDTWKTPGAEFAYFNKENGLVVAAGWLLSAGPSSQFDNRGSRFFLGLRIGNLEKDNFTIAVQGYFVIDRTTGFQEGEAWGGSAWTGIRGAFLDEELKDFGLMLRFDLFDPNTNSTTTDFQMTAWAVVTWEPVPFLRCALGYRKGHNFDLSQSTEDVLGIWSHFKF